MNKNNLRKWYRALASGDYLQTSGTLNSYSRFCCLGVACEVAIDNGLDLEIATSEGITAYNNESLVMPQSVVDWFGLEDVIDGNPYLLWDEEMRLATHLNDNDQLSFAQIAEAVRVTYDLGTHEEIMEEK
jgi:hypothetical protein